MTLLFNLEIEPDDNDTLLITCPSIPGVVTFANTEAEVVRWSTDAIETMLNSMMSHGESLPSSDTEAAGVFHVRLGLMTSLKAELYEACRTCGVTRAELARRLGWHREQVDRLFRLNHASRLDQLEAAFEAVGRKIELEVRIAA